MQFMNYPTALVQIQDGMLIFIPMWITSWHAEFNRDDVSYITIEGIVSDEGARMYSRSAVELPELTGALDASRLLTGSKT